MGSGNRLKLGLFGANCSSGRAVTMVPERWSGGWKDCARLAQMADRAGIEFMLPIGRWKGYGGETDYQGATFETVTWACGLLAKTERLVVFGTVHAPLIAPLIAAKEFVTADHIGEGRFGLNLVCGWNEGEFEMFGATLRDHEARYAYAQEWLDVVKLAWSAREDFDFAGQYLKLKGGRAKPKPYAGTRPLIMNAGASSTGQSFAIRNCDALFSNVSRGISFEETVQHVANVKALARQCGREIDVYARNLADTNESDLRTPSPIELHDTSKSSGSASTLFTFWPYLLLASLLLFFIEWFINPRMSSSNLRRASGHAVSIR